MRRTGATLLANAGVSALELRQAGSWRSSSVAESYIANSEVSRMNQAKKMRMCESFLADLESDDGSELHMHQGASKTIGSSQSNQISLDLRNAKGCNVFLGFPKAGGHLGSQKDF